jgi:hypothetical protein
MEKGESEIFCHSSLYMACAVEASILYCVTICDLVVNIMGFLGLFL